MNETYECRYCATNHTWAEAHGLGMVCGRCERHTGNNHQGHYWSLCKVTHDLRGFHFCCPDNCELEATA